MTRPPPSASVPRTRARKRPSTRRGLLSRRRAVAPAPLSNTLGELARHPRFDRLRLRGLSRQDVGTFLEGVFGRPPAAELVSALHSQTEGNPLFLTEIVRFLVQEGVLTPERAHPYTPSGQSAGTGVRVRIPEGIRDVIGQRLNRLSEQCNHLLGIASVIGREFSLEEVSVLPDAGGAGV